MLFQDFFKIKKIKKELRIVTITLFLILYCANHANAFDLDMTVDDDIRKNYNASKLVKDTKTDINNIEEALPALPDNLKNETINPSKKQEHATYVQIPQNITSGVTKIKKGTSFDVINTTNISDWQKKGSTVKFRTNKTIYKKKYTIPSGTIFSGEIIESHQPQISANGGLVVIRIRYMTYKGQNIQLNAYVTRANDKIIFLNNIKGERKYLKTMWRKGNWGRTLFNRMLSLTINLGGSGSTLVLSPFPLAYGTICLGANAIVSPITAFFTKGGHVSIPSGRNFKIKLLEDAYIN